LLIPGAAFQEELMDAARGTIVENLCQIIQWPQGEDNNLSVPEWAHPFIYPELLGTQWYLQPAILCRYGDTFLHVRNDYLESEPVMVVLKLEAILEQLIARDGICCPYYRYRPDMPRPCPCQPWWKEALLRILQWAREGKFDLGYRGYWKDLPQEAGLPFKKT
jgi:hypothetical protein